MGISDRIGALGIGGAPKGTTIVSDGQGWVATPGGMGPPLPYADAATVTFDLSASLWHLVTIEDDRTFALSGVEVGQMFTIGVKQDATGSRLVTWWPGILWVGAAAPTLSTGAGALDVFTFKCVADGVYWGFVAGQGLG